MTQTTTTSNHTGKRLAKIGAWLQLCPLIGLLGTVIGMMRAFKMLGTQGIGDPSQLSGAIGEVLIATYIGQFGGLIGSVFLALAIWRYGFRPRWIWSVFTLSLLVSSPAIWMTYALMQNVMYPQMQGTH